VKTTLIHVMHDYVELRYQGEPLFRYVYEPGTPAVESPKPYFHPLRTLAGNEVTVFRPHDHPWHTGMTMAFSHLCGQNFWGGPTYVRDIGYVPRDDHGRIQHRDWPHMHSDDAETRLVEHLDWIARDGERWIDEERQIVVGEIDPGGGYWSMDLGFRLRNVGGRPLVFGSPTVEGRTLAGYGSLFWRGPRSFLDGKILAADGLEGPEIMGRPAPWLAFVGSHDGNGEQSTVVFMDRPSNPRYPNKWFVRNDPYACVSCSFMFDQAYVLQADEELALNYRVVFGCGEWSRAAIEAYVSRVRPADRDAL